MSRLGAPGRVPLTRPLTDEIVDRAGLSGEWAWRDLGGAWTTNLLAVRSDRPEEPLVFRVHQDFTPLPRLLAEQRARRTLAAAGIPTVEPAPVFAGEPVALLATGNLVEAEPFVRSDGQLNTPEHLVEGFSLLGAVHRVLRSSDLDPAARTVAYANHVPAESAAALTRAGAERIVSWGDRRLSDFARRAVDHIDRVAALERELATAQLRQVVHGDYWDNNVLFRGRRVVAVLDFGFMAERPRVDDLALPIWFALLEPGHPLPGAADRELVAEMLARYDAGSDLPLTADERLSVPLAVARQPAWSIGRWVRELDAAGAIEHARAAAAELPVAAAVLRDLRAWQQALDHRPLL